MKKLITLLGIIGLVIFTSCEGPEGPPGLDGQDGQDGLISEVYDLKNVNFGKINVNEYSIYKTLNPLLFDGDVILVYRLAGTIDASTPIWEQIPRTFYLSQGNLNYDFDFSKEDFTIYASGNYDLSLTPSYINNQTFRIVIVPGNDPIVMTAKSSQKKVDFSDYNAVIKAYNIDDSNVKVLK